MQTQMYHGSLARRLQESAVIERKRWTNGIVPQILLEEAEHGGFGVADVVSRQLTVTVVADEVARV